MSRQSRNNSERYFGNCAQPSSTRDFNFVRASMRRVLGFVLTFVRTGINVQRNIRTVQNLLKFLPFLQSFPSCNPITGSSGRVLEYRTPIYRSLVYVYSEGIKGSRSSGALAIAICRRRFVRSDARTLFLSFFSIYLCLYPFRCFLRVNAIFRESRVW